MRIVIAAILFGAATYTSYRLFLNILRDDLREYHAGLQGSTYREWEWEWDKDAE